MKKSFCRWILKCLGWTIGPAGEDIPKSVICVAPHTSNFDFILGQIYYAAIDRKACFLIKKEWFFFPLKLIFRYLGGIPIDRSKKTSTTELLADTFAQRETFHLVITPEGTRSHVKEWKKGFYYLALKANVPIQIAYIDYGKKKMGFSTTFYPTGNADEDIQTIRSFYKGMQGLHRDKFTD